ncbi:HD-GYP domain-containing protein [Niameybacter massiliensis]|uniref:HD-GYP domain-containing protein n=1 Tax=Niameybacter massiliensis TaxID=1658108 RepID=UPI0006B42320|nr:HD-GYP domain-containing protein [Niameybacter massiliensis]
MKQLTLKQKSFFLSIYAIAVSLIIYSTIQGCFKIETQQIREIIFFIFVIGLSESVTLCFKKVSFSTTFALTLATYLTLGPLPSLICLLGGFLIRVLKIDENKYKHILNTPLYGTAFNCSMLIISFLISHLLYTNITIGLSIENQFLGIIAFSISYFLVNKGLLAMLQGIYAGGVISKYFKNEFFLSMISFLIMIPFGWMFAVLYEHYSYWGIIVPLFPVLLIRYTFTYYAEAKEQYVQTVETLMNAVEARDCYTNGHSKRVAEVASLIAKKLGYRNGQIEKLRIAAMLHDIGKIGISDNILHKPGKLTDEEFATIKSHPEIGEGIIKDVSNLKYTRSIIRNHHERYDGKGYPDGKKGDELSVDVYIIQLADAIDAMASDRPYRKGLPADVIESEIRKGRGTQFHPHVVDAYLDLLQSNAEIQKIWE